MLQSKKIILLGLDEYQFSKYPGVFTYLLRTSSIKKKLQRVYEGDKNAEISKGKTVTTAAFNALQQLFWPHLCGEDP